MLWAPLKGIGLARAGNAGRRRLAQLQENDKAVLIYSTYPSQELAESIGAELVDARLAACVNVMAGMTSIYRWQGERHRDSEVVMIIKTRARLAERVIAAVRDRHPYENPALIVLPAEGGSQDFIAWIMEQTGATGGG
jgi:periplasmic divalent cation tolerance protein